MKETIETVEEQRTWLKGIGIKPAVEEVDERELLKKLDRVLPKRNAGRKGNFGLEMLALAMAGSILVTSSFSLHKSRAESGTPKLKSESAVKEKSVKGEVKTQESVETAPTLENSTKAGTSPNSASKPSPALKPGPAPQPGPASTPQGSAPSVPKVGAPVPPEIGVAPVPSVPTPAPKVEGANPPNTNNTPVDESGSPAGTRADKISDAEHGSGDPALNDGTGERTPEPDPPELEF